MFTHRKETAELIIASRPVGSAQPPILWPDIDVYFRQDENLAIRLIDLIAEAGGGFLKAAVLHRTDLALTGYSVDYFNHTLGVIESREYRRVLEEHVVGLPQLERLFRRSARAGLALVLSIYDTEGLAFAQSMGAVALKIPSSNITHKRLIKSAASTGTPVVLDTGRSRWWEIERAVEWAYDAGATRRLMLQHSPAAPPAPPERFHMRMVHEMSETFKVPVGLSDHHLGLDMVPIAIAYGASVIEKGVVVNSTDTGIDRAHALPIDRVPEALGLMRSTWLALGQRRRPDDEVCPHSPDRLGCVTSRDLRAGHRIEVDDIGYAFPAVGVPAEHTESLVGCHLLHDLAKGMPIEPRHVTHCEDE